MPRRRHPFRPRPISRQRGPPPPIRTRIQSRIPHLPLLPHLRHRYSRSFFPFASLSGSRPPRARRRRPRRSLQHQASVDCSPPSLPHNWRLTVTRERERRTVDFPHLPRLLSLTRTPPRLQVELLHSHLVLLGETRGGLVSVLLVELVDPFNFFAHQRDPTHLFPSRLPRGLLLPLLFQRAKFLLLRLLAVINRASVSHLESSLERRAKPTVPTQAAYDRPRSYSRTAFASRAGL